MFHDQHIMSVAGENRTYSIFKLRHVHINELPRTYSNLFVTKHTDLKDEIVSKKDFQTSFSGQKHLF